MKSARPRICLVNRSNGFLGDSPALKMMAAIQRQVSGDFAKAWGQDASLTYLRAGSRQAPAPGDWLVVICQNPGHAAELGYHDLTPQGKPLAIVYAEQDGELSVTLSHEILEMLADPSCNGFEHRKSDSLLYAREVCDAVESDTLGYRIQGILVSDFVLPAFFVEGAPGPYDWKRSLRAPFEIADGGYLAALDPSTGDWRELAPSVLESHPAGSRLERRLRALSADLRASDRSTHAPLAATPKPQAKVPLRRPIPAEKLARTALPKPPAKVLERQPDRRLAPVVPSSVRVPERQPLRGFRAERAAASADPAPAVVQDVPAADKPAPARQPLRGFRAEEAAKASSSAAGDAKAPEKKAEAPSSGSSATATPPK